MLGVAIDITEQKRAEQELQRLNEELEQRVSRRTAELEAANKRLEAEIAEREQIDRALREQTDIMQSMLDSTAEGVVVADENGKFLIWNVAARRLVGLGHTDAPVEKWSETYRLYQLDGRTLYPPQELPLTRAIRGESVDEVELLVRRPGESEPGHLSVNARPIVDEAGRNRGGVVVFRDVADIKKAEERTRQREEELAHATRLTTMGEMASGLAHELNQPLAAISNYVNGCRQRLAADNMDPAHLDDALKNIAHQARRAGEIIKRMRTFVRKPEPRRASTSINDAVSAVAALLEPDARRHHATVRLDLADDLPDLLVDPVQIEQVILNLVRNAFEAMDARPPGERRVIVTTARDGGGVCVAPSAEGVHLTMPPRHVGGNLDTRHLCKGSTLFLPVEVSGALFSVGDGHLAQGDGEVCFTAIEAPLTVSLRLSVLKGRSIKGPEYMTQAPTTSKTDGMGYYATTGDGPDLAENVRNAVRRMVDYLMTERGLRQIEAYVLCSAAGDLKVSVPVLGEGHSGLVTFSMPLSIFVG